MIRHVVIWKLASSEPDQRTRDAAGIRERLAALVGVVPGLRSLTVAGDIGAAEGNWDLVLISEHDDEAALDGYQKHPAHLEAATFVHSLVQARACVDASV